MTPEQKREKYRRAVERRRAERLRDPVGLPPEKSPMTMREYLAWRDKQADAPPDTRNLTARLCGDPPPGRSALDRGRQ